MQNPKKLGRKNFKLLNPAFFPNKGHFDLIYQLAKWAIYCIQAH
jgi:hypothetical protein